MQNVTGSDIDTKLTFRKPEREDGAAIWELIGNCDPLDENSMYCNLIQCDHFGDTCILAELDGVPVGWVSAYILPDNEEALFVWQVAVSEKARGLGLATRMLDQLCARDECAAVRCLQTTITLDNDASWALFKRFADDKGARLSSQPHFKRDDHFDGQHSTEHMVTIQFAAELSRVA